MDDTVTFVQPRANVYVTMLWVIAAVWALCNGLWVLILFAFGLPPRPDDILPIAERLLIVPVVTAAVVMLVAWNRLGWLHSSEDGLEFAATGRRAVRMPWSGIASVTLRHAGVFTELVVTPAAAESVTVVPGPGRAPRVLRRGGQTAYLVDVGLMSPGPKTLLEELHRRLPSRV